MINYTCTVYPYKSGIRIFANILTLADCKSTSLVPAIRINVPSNTPLR